MFNDGCPFIHDDIEILYGVPPMPIEELPKVCTCGKPLTYRNTVIFISQPMPMFTDCDGVVVSEPVTIFQKIREAKDAQGT